MPADTAPDAAADWGVTLEAQSVTPSGLSIVCRQSGGTDIAELLTGSYYVIQRLENGEWTDVPYLPHEYEIAWTSEAWLIPEDAEKTWDVDWEWLYGTLTDGTYRIGKEIMNWKESGDSEQVLQYAEFTIQS